MRSTGEPSASELLEQAVEVLRWRPLAKLAPYWIGTAPFAAALLYFLFEMSGGVYAAEKLFPWSVALTVLWAWMNFWQSVYCQRLRAAIADEQDRRWDTRRIINTALIQIGVQSPGLVALPAALMIVVPFPWVYSLFQCLTCEETEPETDLRTVWRRARGQAGLWQKESWKLIAILMLLGIATFLNVAVAGVVITQLTRSFAGITSPTAGVREFSNVTYFAFVAAVAYLLVDPLAKAAYAVRGFAADSIHTGADIRVSLKRVGRTAAAALILLSVSSPASSAETANISAPYWSRFHASNNFTEPRAPASGSFRSPDPAQLDRTIDDVLREPEYSWRVPRELKPRTGDSWIERTADSIYEGLTKCLEMLGKVINWFLDLLTPELPIPGSGTGSGGRTARRLMTVLLVFLAIALIAVMWRLRPKPLSKTVSVIGLPAAQPVDLSDESLSASELPQDEWLRLADEFLAKGEARLALRAVFFSALARLQRDNLIMLARFKTNLDYDRELGRRTRHLPHVRPAFRRLVQTFERCWYGVTAPDETTVARARALLSEMDAHA